jgi:hypothetical protein
VLIAGAAIDSTLVTVVSPNEITAIMPAHDEGFAPITVANGDATSSTTSSFEFVAAPIVKMISPTHGPISGGTAIAVVGNHFRDGATTILIGTNGLAAPHFVSANRIEGLVPPGVDTGWATVQATDMVGGTSTLLDAFMYDPVAPDLSDAGVNPTSDGGTP